MGIANGFMPRRSRFEAKSRESQADGALIRKEPCVFSEIFRVFSEIFSSSFQKNSV